MYTAPKLLPHIKSRLDITWDDEATDTKMLGIIEDGIAFLDGQLGAPGDYSTPSHARMLLAEYCRYVRDGALDVFENNFRSQLLSMQNERAVERHAAETISSE